MKHDTDWLSVALPRFHRDRHGAGRPRLKWASSSEGCMKELQDRGTPFIRRWVACDRRLIDPHGAAAVSPLEPSNLAAALTTPI